MKKVRVVYYSLDSGRLGLMTEKTLEYMIQSAIDEIEAKGDEVLSVTSSTTHETVIATILYQVKIVVPGSDDAKFLAS